jgi:hypothetical protein
LSKTASRSGLAFFRAGMQDFCLHHAALLNPTRLTSPKHRRCQPFFVASKTRANPFVFSPKKILGTVKKIKKK